MSVLSCKRNTKKRNKTESNKKYIGKELMKEKRNWMKSGEEKMMEGKIEGKKTKEWTNTEGSVKADKMCKEQINRYNSTDWGCLQWSYSWL